MDALQRQLSSLAPRHTLFMQVRSPAQRGITGCNFGGRFCMWLGWPWLGCPGVGLVWKFPPLPHWSMRRAAPGCLRLELVCRLLPLASLS